MVRGWLLILENIFGPTVILKKTLQKLALDQLAFAPFNQTIMLTSVGLMQGLTSLQLIKEKLKNELPTVMFTGWKVIFSTSIYVIPS